MKITSEKLAIPGSVGQLEAIVDSGQIVSNEYVAVCCHPHPQHAGTMTNKVIHTAARSLAGLGIPSIRFNFRGVGASEGEYANGIGERDDLAAVVSWARDNFADRELILVGFSFGSYISAMVANQLEPKLLISIAPPIGRIEFTGFVRPNCPWLIVQGEQDELVESQAVFDWASKFEQSPQLIMLPDTSHFFHGKLVDLRNEIEYFCQSNLDLPLSS
ncbi:MAG: alpha/beta fold hydrolase [Kangiellaceae bacterium]|nr:alpha/beta fold hydrolase [Kangiellaceae bacterium]